MESANIGGAAEFAFVSRRNSSLIPDRFCLVLGSLAVISLAIAGGFAVVGAWLILPFAGAEVAALAVALRCVRKRAGDYERVAIHGDEVVLDVCEDSARRSFRFNRLWAQLVVSDGAPRFEVSLRSHGREVVVGRYLDEDGRRALARELRCRLQGR
ncbi:MAG: DUF2244 domain-containing protein [Betaproteobacteria bacterium]|nr:DUF2244 domain-containing protein [Betaproteobacteria bacterium]